MRNLSTCCALLLAAAPAAALPIRHDFLALDEGLMQVMRVNENNPKDNWIVRVGHDLPRDMQLEGGGRLLISHDAGYSEYDIATGRRVNDVARYHDVSSVRRLENGHLLIAGVDFDGRKLNKGHSEVGDPGGRHVLFVEYDERGQQVRRTTYVGDYLRIVRQTATGTYLCAVNTVFKEADGSGQWIRSYPVAGFQHAWKGVRLASGHLLMSSGYGTSNPPHPGGTAFLVELAPDGRVLRRFGDVTQVPAEVKPNFYGLFQLLPNGNVVVANWQGHKGGHQNQGVQLLEFDPAGKIVWEWSDRHFVSSLQGVLVLDGLDLSRLHDEREGVMAPVR